MTDYFKTVKKPAPAGQGDFSGIPKGPLTVSPDKEKEILAASEEQGFKSREPISEATQGDTGVRRTKAAIKSKSVFIKGPEEVIDWFIGYTNEGDYKSYWEALEDLKKRAGA